MIQISGRQPTFWTSRTTGWGPLIQIIPLFFKHGVLNGLLE